MATVNEIHEFLKTLAPEYMAYDWDHVGLLCGRRTAQVQRILVALDPFLSVAQEAAEEDCQLLLTHHPAIWDLQTASDNSIEGEVLLYLAEHGIAALNAHTNLDCVSGGVNDCLAAKLRLREVSVVNPVGTDAQGRDYGLLRSGCLPEEMTVAQLVAHVKAALGCQGVRYTGEGRLRRIAVGGGACASELLHAKAAGAQALVTADCKYNDFANAKALGIALIDAGHFQTENPVCAYLADRLCAAFPEVEVLLSRHHKDCIQFA